MLLTAYSSNSLIGSLSREANLIRRRVYKIIMSLPSCNSKPLISRLNEEFKILEERRQDILSIALELQNNKLIESLSIEYLIEICKRPV